MDYDHGAFVEEARQRMLRKLGEVILKRLPDADPVEAARVLLDGSDEERHALVQQLDSAIANSAAGQAPGISPAERDAVSEKTGSSWYALGPGDQNAHASMRDANLLNAALGRKNVVNIRDLTEGGHTHATDEEGFPVEVDYDAGPNLWAGGASDQDRARNRAASWLDASDYHDSGENEPERHSSWMGANFPQYSLIGAQGTLTNISNMGDTVAGGLWAGANAGAEAARRALRRDEPDLLNENTGRFGPDAAAWVTNNAYKLVKNLPSELPKQLAYDSAQRSVTGASPRLPGDMDPVSRVKHLKQMRDNIGKAGVPTVEQYGASRGETYSPAWAWFQDMMPETADPFTLGSMGWGAAKAVGAGTLKGAATQAVKAAAREGVSETASPWNYALGMFTLPAVSKAFTAPKLEGSPEVHAAEYAQKQQDSDSAIENIRRLKRVRDQGR